MKRLLFLLLIVSLAAALLPACSVSPMAAVEPTPGADEALEPVVSATGVVVPARWSTLSMPAAGIIAEVLVEEGQQVEAEQVLIRLQGQDALLAALEAANTEMLNAQQALDALKETASQVTAQAQLRLAVAQKALDKAKDNRAGKDYQRADPSLVAASKADVIMAKDEFKRAEEAWGYWEGKDEEDVNRAYALAQFEAARRKRDRAIWNLNYLESKPEALEVNVSEGELQVAQAEVDAAQRDWERVKDGPDPRALALAEARLMSVQAHQAAAKTALENLELRAPFAGTVTRLNARVQEWASPGQPVMVLADIRRLRVETTDLNEIDVARIAQNDLVNVTFDALPGARILGKVSRISSRAAEGAGVNYPVTIELAEVPEGLRWGMTAFVDIQVKEK